ncbi:DedA family protein/thiosulfate sulfurtransferase GlpE [Noviluteimonas gilva]|uniref:Sulfurtransferase n=1 Tax=Noviluteimonas gilva TaxID=2682097 RepID=A0A7C9LHY0_9GAMM|nr:DedA family protein/thiosulfate sulfurtransferase GlpE [Lysobacter gilvus]MUV15241.1 sulfurtransferase [Lysobacter gilvus]
MEVMLHLIATWGLLVVFASVLLDQGGIPVPAYPLIIVTTAVAIHNDESTFAIFLVATLAAVLADWAWFLGGRRFGNTLVRLMCKLSLSPDSCVMRTRGVYGRWGPASLIVAKFVPGFAAVATTLAGQTGTKTRTFLFYDAIGAALWAGGAVVLGIVFEDAVEDVLLALENLGHLAVPVLLGLIAAFIAWKWWRRRRFLRALRMARISPAELDALIASGSSPLILDVRDATQRENTGWIPGAMLVRTPDEAHPSPQGEVIVYCDCPNEISAAVLAHALRARGFHKVRPLAGGFDAWRAEGRAIEGGLS